MINILCNLFSTIGFLVLVIIMGFNKSLSEGDFFIIILLILINMRLGGKHE
jgi:hypothetical protein